MRCTVHKHCCPMVLTLAHKLSPSVADLKPSATLLINERSKTLAAAGKKVYRLGFGQSPFPVPGEVVQALRDHASEKDYLPGRGLYALREAVAGFTQKTKGLACSAEDVMIGPGSKELMFSLQMALDADLLLPSPSWVSYEPQAHILQKKTHWLETREEDGWRLQAATLDRACAASPARSKLLILNYPNNPVGNSYDGAQLKALAEVARRYGVIVLADEIYSMVHHEGGQCSHAAHYPEGTIVSSGLSKWCGAGGWRLGTFVFPKELRYVLDAMAGIASETFSAVSAPVQFAAITAFKGSPGTDRYVFRSRRVLKTVGRFVYQRLKKMGVTMPAPEGGFYLFPNFEKHRPGLAKKDIYGSAAFCEALLEETGIALLPGEVFGRPPGELSCRLSFVDFDGKAALLASAENVDLPEGEIFVKNNCPKIYEAMDVLAAWLDQD